MKKFILYMIFMAFAICVSAKPYAIESIRIERNGSKEMVYFTYSMEWDDEMEWNFAGDLLSVKTEQSEFTFDYTQLSSGILTMTRVDNNGDTILYEMALNEDGRVQKAIEYINGVLAEDYCTFEYTDGYLIDYRRINPDGVEESIISHTDAGTILKVENTENGNLKETLTYEGVQGAGYSRLCYLMDMFYGIDLDDMEWVAAAGFLGEMINGLPSSISLSGAGETENKILDWTCDVYGIPDRVTITENNETERFDIYWLNGPIVGVDSVKTDADSISRIYTIDGVEATDNTKGVIIERKANGTITKRLNR